MSKALGRRGEKPNTASPETNKDGCAAAPGAGYASGVGVGVGGATPHAAAKEGREPKKYTMA